MGELSATLLTMAILIGGVVWFGAWAEEKSCHAKWKHGGMSVSWDFWEGCRLQRADGTWVPAESYREIP